MWDTMVLFILNCTISALAARPSPLQGGCCWQARGERHLLTVSRTPPVHKLLY